MQLFRETFLLFALNLLDALLTIVWVRNGVATEANHLMARLLDIGDLTFLGVKIAIGTIAAVVLFHWGELRVARYGLTFALTVYMGLMGIHFLTGLSAFGLLSQSFIDNVSAIPGVLMAIIG